MACEDKKAELDNAELATDTAMLGVDQAIAVLKACLEAQRQKQIAYAACLAVNTNPPNPPGP